MIDTVTNFDFTFDSVEDGGLVNDSLDMLDLYDLFDGIGKSDYVTDGGDTLQGLLDAFEDGYLRVADGADFGLTAGTVVLGFDATGNEGGDDSATWDLSSGAADTVAFVNFTNLGMDDIPTDPGVA